MIWSLRETQVLVGFESGLFWSPAEKIRVNCLEFAERRGGGEAERVVIHTYILVRTCIRTPTHPCVCFLINTI